MRYDFKSRNPKSGIIEVVGYMELNNSGAVPELRFYGDIVSDSWGRNMDEDKCPQDVADFLNELDDNAPLDIRINSGGGAVDGGTAIYNRLKRHKGFKTVYIDGIAASIASVIAFSGDKIVMPHGAQLMIHKPWARSRGNADDLRRKADSLDVFEDAMLEIYMKYVKNGVTAAQIKEMMARETWLTSKQAARYFNIDITDTGEAAACASLFFDGYSNLPDGVGKRREEIGEKEDNSRDDGACGSADGDNGPNDEDLRALSILSDLDYI